MELRNLTYKLLFAFFLVAATPVRSQICPSIGVSPQLPTGMMGRSYSERVQAGSWTAVNNSHQPKLIYSATRLTDGKVLAIGDVAALFDPATSTWTPVGARNSYYTGNHTATLLQNGKVLIAGGWAAWTNAEIFDPTSKTFTPTGALNSGHDYHAAVLLPNGKVLVAGGDSAFPWRRAELYDPATGTWTSTGLMTVQRKFPTATLLPNGKVLLAGGEHGGATAELYDPVSDTWTATGSMKDDRMYHIAKLLPNGKVLVVGGYQSFSDLTPRCELYDPTTGTWRPTGSMNAKRCASFTSFGALLPNGNVFVAGSGSPEAEIYNPATETWTPAGAIGVQDPQVIALPDGKVLLAGGGTKGELHDPNDAIVYSYGIGGSLPPGLSFATNGLLTGVPSTPGTYTFSVAATNAGGCSGITQCTLIIQDPALENPTIAITEPANNAVLTNPAFDSQGNRVVDILGKAKDKSTMDYPRVKSVSILLNGIEQDSYWDETPEGNFDWFLMPLVQPGWNTIIAQAEDYEGNFSIPKTNRFYVKLLEPLIITVNGVGSTSLTSGNYELAKSYTITATPGVNYLFSNWVASVNGGAPEAVSISAKYTFIMESNLTLTANFVPNHFIPAAGKYQALFSEAAGVAHQTAGLLTLNVRNNAAFSATMVLDGDKIPVSGKFNVDGTVTKTISRSKYFKDDLTLTLALDFSNGTEKVSGSVSSTGWSSLLDGDRAITSTTADNYTLLIPGFADPIQGPPGYSYGSTRRLANGFIKFSGGTSDGLTLAQSLPVSKYSRWPFYVPLYKTTKTYANGSVNRSYCLGSMMGWVTISNNAPTGTIDWNKTAGAGGLYPNGFAHRSALLGSHYTVPPFNTPAVDFTNGTLILTNGNLSTALVRDVFVKPTGSVGITPTAGSVKMIIARTKGLFTGSFQHPDNANKVTTIKGAVLQDHDSAGGYFVGIDQGGLVQLEGD